MLLFKSFKRNFLKLFIITLMMLLITLPFACVQLYFPHAYRVFSNILSQHRLLFTLFRWLLIVLLFLYWPSLVRLIAKNQYWHPDKVMFWLAQRFRVIGWLIVFELLVCENLLLMLLKLFVR